MELSKVLAEHRTTLATADHGSYHAHLTRRLLSLRRKLGLVTHKSQKFAYRDVTSEDVSKDTRHYELILLQAERAWARAMHLKALRGEGEGGLTGRDRKEVVSKCAKAAKLADSIVELLKENKASSQDVVEGSAYAAMMRGSTSFERLASGATRHTKEEWEKCLSQWSTARILYAALAEKNGHEAEKDLITNTIDPTIRYAAYQAGVPRTVGSQDISRKYFVDGGDLKTSVEELDPFAFTGRPKAYGERTAKGEIPQTIAWRGRSANIIDAAIGQALASVYAAEAKLRAYLNDNKTLSSRDKAAAYDEVLIASQDAADATKRATDELEKERVEESDARMQNLRITSLAINHNLISWRVGRNRMLIGEDDGLSMPHRTQKNGKEESTGRKLSQLKERLVLLNAILQSIDSIRELPGAMRDEAFVEELEAKTAYFQALRCVTISFSHVLCGDRLKSLALLTKANNLLAATPSNGPAAVKDGPSTLEIDKPTFEAVRKTVASLQLRSHASATMRQIEKNAAVADAKHMTSDEPWLSRLIDFPTPGVQIDLAHLVAYPPKLEPVPMKPIFLDIAWNYIDYPGHSAPVVSAVPTTNGASADAVEEKKRGWFGFGR